MRKGYVAAILSVWLWGLTYAASQRVGDDLSPPQLMLISAIVNIFGSLVLLWYTGQPLPAIESSDLLKWLAVLEVSGFAANYFIFVAINELGAVRASIFEIGYPLTTAIFCILLFGEALTWRIGFGAFLIFLGSLCVALDR